MNKIFSYEYEAVASKEPTTKKQPAGSPKMVGENKGRRQEGVKLGRIGPMTTLIEARIPIQAHYINPRLKHHPQIQLRSLRVGFSPPALSHIHSAFLGFSLYVYPSPAAAPLPITMDDTNNETELEMNYNSEASIGDKRKREGRLRSKVWQHFTKIMKEDGRYEKCQCNHCQKLFTCSSRSGTTHLLRHITDGICPVFKKDNKDKMVTISSYTGLGPEQRISVPAWNGPGAQSSAQQCMDIEVVELQPTNLEPPLFRTIEDGYGGQIPLRSKLPQQSALKSHRHQPKGEAWVNEFRGCVAKLVELGNGKIPVGSLQALTLNAPDYSISAALKCLNEMDDIPQSSDMYLDAFEILQDAGERECFICLPAEPRRRWLQRVLHRRYPMQYGSNI